MNDKYILIYTTLEVRCMYFNNKMFLKTLHLDTSFIHTLSTINCNHQYMDPFRLCFHREQLKVSSQWARFDANPMSGWDRKCFIKRNNSH